MALNKKGRAAVILAFVLLAGCRSGEKVQLRVNFEKGKTYLYQLETRQAIAQTVMGRFMKYDQTFAFTFSLKVTDVDQEGNITMETTYDSIRYEQISDAGTIRYNSSYPEPDSTGMTLPFRILKGGKFVMVMSPEGKVKQVRGYREMLDSMMSKLPSVSDSARENLRRSITSQFTDENIRESIESTWNIYPPNPVGKGDKWLKKTSVSSGFPLEVENTYKMSSLTDSTAGLDLVSRMKSPENQAKNPMGLTYQIDGDQEGTINIDRKTGLIRNGEIRQFLKGKVIVKNSATGTMDWPLDLKSTIHITSKEL